MLIDEVTLRISAGHGGKGSVAWNKNVMSLGPAGGAGGEGGSVIFEAVSDLGALHQFRYKKEVSAEDGEDGKAQFNDGTAGKDLIVKIPVGSVIHVEGMRTVRELVKLGDRILIAKGGRGGKGNFAYRSAKNTSPREFQPGLPGEAFVVRIELKLIADVGIIGLPNAGKSSLLNALTNAKSKIGNYQFTTLEPHLGTYYGLILADIPGLIEGASAGKGLGTQFLRHIERTRVLFHLISCESEDPVRDYAVIRKELGTYNSALLEKEEYIFVTKADEATPTRVQEVVSVLETTCKKPVFAISVLDDEAISPVVKILRSLGVVKSKTG